MAMRGAEVAQLREAALHLGVELAGGIELVAQLDQQARHAGAAVGQHLAHQQVDGLDLVGALVDHGHARIAQHLLDAPFAHVAVAAEDLQAVAGAVEGLLRAGGLQHRRDERARSARRARGARGRRRGARCPAAARCGRPAGARRRSRRAASRGCGAPPGARRSGRRPRRRGWPAPGRARASGAARGRRRRPSARPRPAGRCPAAPRAGAPRSSSRTSRPGRGSARRPASRWRRRSASRRSGCRAGPSFPRCARNAPRCARRPAAAWARGPATGPWARPARRAGGTAPGARCCRRQVVLAAGDEDLAAADAEAAIRPAAAARVRTWPRSLPAWASVRHMVASHSPLAIFGR